MVSNRSLIFDALSALERGERSHAADLLQQELNSGPGGTGRWGNIAKLAEKIGEIDLAIDASRRVALSEPITLGGLLKHCGLLAQMGRSEEALGYLDRLPANAKNHPASLHFRSTIASEEGDFEKAEALLRDALKIEPSEPQAWFGLAMAKTFAAGDPDFEALASVEVHIGSYDALTQSRYHYAMGKALVDMDDIEQAFVYYDRGARIRRQAEPYDYQLEAEQARRLIEGFSKKSLEALKPSQFKGQRALFVHGLPRSGTTLVESILASHSEVGDGAEINLFHPATIPTFDGTFDGALKYQSQTAEHDPFGALAADYHRMLDMRFRQPGLVVDKTLNQSMVMGLALHSMPEARVVWLRRNPEDVALSSYRAFFTSSVPWSWSMEDIARHMKIEDALHDHWTHVFPDRILTVSYEDLVRVPEEGIAAIVNHFGLQDEPQTREFHMSKRKIRTASVKQVRAPISSEAIGKAARFSDQLARFRETYFT
ncbi:MAG: hypothetical protein CL574_06310 [Altererythrobacter sp.]|mgnify:FL=1|nr:hypothetical protein [Altererythrobacter sp.]|tara:strand:+ start:818 stop:2272 length:1455 start_codon:yes stop_codon:yes gene_type:complete